MNPWNSKASICSLNGAFGVATNPIVQSAYVVRNLLMMAVSLRYSNI